MFRPLLFTAVPLLAVQLTVLALLPTAEWTTLLHEAENLDPRFRPELFGLTEFQQDLDHDPALPLLNPNLESLLLPSDASTEWIASRFKLVEKCDGGGSHCSPGDFQLVGKRSFSEVAARETAGEQFRQQDEEKKDEAFQEDLDLQRALALSLEPRGGVAVAAARENSRGNVVGCGGGFLRGVFGGGSSASSGKGVANTAGGLENEVSGSAPSSKLEAPMDVDGTVGNEGRGRLNKWYEGKLLAALEETKIPLDRYARWRRDVLQHHEADGYSLFANPDANMYGVDDCPALDVWDEWR